MKLTVEFLAPTGDIVATRYINMSDDWAACEWAFDHLDKIEDAVDFNIRWSS